MKHLYVYTRIQASAAVYEGRGLRVQGTCLFVLIGLLAVVYSSTTENDTTSAFQFICITVSACLPADRWLARCVDAPDDIRIRSKYFVVQSEHSQPALCSSPLVLQQAYRL